MTVLGKKVTVSTGGTTEVRVPGVGEVRLDLSRRGTTSRTAVATALELTVSVNPSKLNVAEVTGTLTLAQATCETPAVKTSAAEPAGEVKAQGAPVGADLARTGGNSTTPYVAGGAVGLPAAGGERWCWPAAGTELLLGASVFTPRPRSAHRFHLGRLLFFVRTVDHSMKAF